MADPSTWAHETVALVDPVVVVGPSGWSVMPVTLENPMSGDAPSQWGVGYVTLTDPAAPFRVVASIDGGPWQDANLAHWIG